MAEINDPMPVFTIKAKDALALDAVDFYRWLCERDGLTEQAAEVVKAHAEMEGWRMRNPAAVKLPDHPHVPVSGGTPEPTDG